MTPSMGRTPTFSRLRRFSRRARRTHRAWLSNLERTCRGPGCSLAVHVVLQIAFIVRALLRPHREPASRLAWVIGDHRGPGGRHARLRALRRDQHRPPPHRAPPPGDGAAAAASPRSAGTRARREAGDAAALRPLFRVGHSISGFPAVGGNRGRLLGDSDDVIDAHRRRHRRGRATTSTCCFYIWLADSNGLKVVEALKRAAARGVTCRAMADDLGSRADDPLASTGRRWREAGVKLARALPIGFPLSRPLKGRIDMRNHRKIVVIDNRITYCGSQNCADAAFAHQGEVRALGRRDDALRGPDRAAEPAALRRRLDGARQRGHLRELFARAAADRRRRASRRR